MSARRGGGAAVLIACLVLFVSCTAEMTPRATPTPSLSAAPAASPSVSPEPSASPSPTPDVSHCPGTDRTPGETGRSLDPQSSKNWAGYIAYDRRGRFSCVEGSWQHPAVSCPTRGKADVAVWVGIDGVRDEAASIDSSATLVQIGTNAACEAGQGSDFAWYQVIPEDDLSVHIDAIDVRPGDELHGLVSWADGTFTLELVDTTTGQSFVIERPLDGAARQTAEWIVEAPTIGCPSNCHIADIPDFDVIAITGAYAALGSRLGSISDDAWVRVLTDLVRSGTIDASVSRLRDGGTRFKVTWHHAD